MKAVLWRAIPTALFACVLGWQLFGPHPIGKGDNGDFPKVLGPIGVWVAPENKPELYGYFVTDYRIDETHIWDPETPSTEVWLARAAKSICGLILPPGRFDLRVLGAIHAAIATLAFYLFLVPLRTHRLLLTALFFVIFADPQYVQFYSTAYMDTASLVFFMLVFATAWNQWPLLFCISASLFLGTKLQHQVCAIPLALFAVAMAYRTRKRLWLLTPVALLAVAIVMVQNTYTAYRVAPLFSAVFTKLLPRDPQALEELKLPAAYGIYNHTHAYSPGSPVEDPVFRATFQNQLPTSRILAYYLRHPAIAADILRGDLVGYAPDIPMSTCGTMRRADNPTPAFRPPGLQPWSILRRKLAEHLPWHILVLYLLALAWREPRWPLAATLAVIGIVSFCAGSLLDATETSRHIILYQETTDLLFLMCFATFLSRPAIGGTPNLQTSTSTVRVLPSSNPQGSELL
jgi:hypothetical protein